MTNKQDAGKQAEEATKISERLQEEKTAQLNSDRIVLNLSLRDAIKVGAFLEATAIQLKEEDQKLFFRIRDRLLKSVKKRTKPLNSQQLGAVLQAAQEASDRQDQEDAEMDQLQDQYEAEDEAKELESMREEIARESEDCFVPESEFEQDWEEKK